LSSRRACVCCTPASALLHVHVHLPVRVHVLWCLSSVRTRHSSRSTRCRRDIAVPQRSGREMGDRDVRRAKREREGAGGREARYVALRGWRAEHRVPGSGHEDLCRPVLLDQGDEILPTPCTHGKGCRWAVCVCVCVCVCGRDRDMHIKSLDRDRQRRRHSLLAQRDFEVESQSEKERERGRGQEGGRE
jgi:hypothetical protein